MENVGFMQGHYKKLGYDKHHKMDDFSVNEALMILSQAEEIKGNKKLMMKVKSLAKEEISIKKTLLQKFGMDKHEMP